MKVSFSSYSTLVLFVALAPFAAAQTLLVFSGSAGPDSGTLAPHITVGNLAVGSDLHDFLIGTSYDASDWTQSETASPNSAFTFTLTPGSGYNINIIGVSFNYKIQGNGPDKVALGYDAVVFDTGNPSNLGPDGESDVDYGLRNAASTYTSGLLNVTLYGGTTYNMYLMGYSSNQPGRNANIDDFTVFGTVTAVPEPTTTAMLFGAVALTGVMIRRRRARG